MLLKILGLIIVKEILDFIYLGCRGFVKDNRNRWVLVGYGGILTLVAYLIFVKVGAKHPIVCTLFTSCPWVMVYDMIRNKNS